MMENVSYLNTRIIEIKNGINDIINIKIDHNSQAPNYPPSGITLAHPKMKQPEDLQ